MEQIEKYENMRWGHAISTTNTMNPLLKKAPPSPLDSRSGVVDAAKSILEMLGLTFLCLCNRSTAVKHPEECKPRGASQRFSQFQPPNFEEALAAILFHS